MELFQEHYEILKKYQNADKNYNKILEKKAMIILQTQPNAVDTTKDNVSGGKVVDKFASFVEKLESIDPELQKLRNERDLQEYFLKKKEIELKNSKECINKIYYYKFVERLRVRHIAIKVNYSHMQVYRYLEEINEKLNMLQNVTKALV